jgi:hypothetical protein
MNDETARMITANAPRIRGNEAIKKNSITFDRIQQTSASRLVGRRSTSAGDIEALTVSGGIEFTGGGTGIQTGAFTGDVTKSAGDTVQTIAAGAVTLSKMANIATDKLIGRDTAGTGVPEALSASGGIEFTGAGGIQRSAITGDVSVPAGSNTATLATVTVGKGGTGLTTLTSGALLTGNGAGNVVPVGPGTTGQIPISNGATIAMTTMGTDATINSAGALTIANNAVTFAKQADVATDVLIGRDTVGTGDPETLTVGGGIEFTGSGGIRTTAFTGDVTKTAGGTALTIAANAVTNTMIRDGGACSVIGRSANSTGDPADISAATNGTILCRRADALSFASPMQYSTKSADYTVIATDNASVITVSASALSRTITLTTAATLASGFTVTIKRIDSNVANTVTIDPNASETIDGALTLVLRAQYQSVTLICDGSNWHIVSWGVANGTYSPVLSGGTTPGTPTYTTQLGRYSLNGKTCTYWITLTTSGLSTAAGNVQISLPFTASTASGFFWVGSSGNANVNLNAGGGYYYQVPIVSSAATNLLLYQVGDNNAQTVLQITDLATVTGFVMSGSYEVT